MEQALAAVLDEAAARHAAAAEQEANQQAVAEGLPEDNHAESPDRALDLVVKQEEDDMGELYLCDQQTVQAPVSPTLGTVLRSLVRVMAVHGWLELYTVPGCYNATSLTCPAVTATSFLSYGLGISDQVVHVLKHLWCSVGYSTVANVSRIVAFLLN